MLTIWLYWLNLLRYVEQWTREAFKWYNHNENYLLPKLCIRIPHLITVMWETISSTFSLTYSFCSEKQESFYNWTIILVLIGWISNTATDVKWNKQKFTHAGKMFDCEKGTIWSKSVSKYIIYVLYVKPYDL